MRVLHLSAYDLMGGAAKAAFRLHTALVEAGEESRMLVRRKDSSRSDVIGPEGGWLRLATKVQRRAEQLLLTPSARAEFSVGGLPDGLARRIRALRPDVLHVHWVSHGFLRLETLVELGLPVVWTMHDMWAFTGGCHYAGACRRYQIGCGECPVLVRPAAEDASRRGVRRRARVSERVPIKFVAPSQWMAECARKSVALAGADVRVIPYALNTEVFSPRDRREARRSLGWAMDGRVVLAGAMGIDSGERKGVRDFWQALGLLAERLAPESLPRVVVFGTAQQREVRVGRLLVSELGYVSNESRLVDIYAAADVFVASSKEDNLPNTVMEALAAGVPVVGSRVGGIPDMVEHEVNGLLVEPGNVAEMSFAMLRLLTDERLRAACASGAREKVLRCYSPDVIVRAHRALYREIGEGL